jgi:hypothetical protein
MALYLLVAGAQVTIVPRGSRESSCSKAVFAVVKQKGLLKVIRNDGPVL